MTSATDLTVVMVTCDRFADVAAGFLALWSKFWPGCKLSKVVATDGQRVVAPDGWNVNRTIAGQSWSDVLASALHHVDSRWVLLVLDEDYLCRKVDEEKIGAALSTAVASDALCVRLWNLPHGNGAEVGEFREHVPGSLARTALQAAIWNREKLLALLVSGESNWDFELAGARRSDVISPAGVLVPRKPLLDYEEATQAGKWKQRAIWLCMREGIAIDWRRGKLLP